jgi:hypothetical protein
MALDNSAGYEPTRLEAKQREVQVPVHNEYAQADPDEDFSQEYRRRATR